MSFMVSQGFELPGGYTWGPLNPQRWWCLHIGDPRGLILYNMASTHHSHCRFDDHFWLCELQGYLEGDCRWQVPSQAGCYLLKAWGWGHHVHWFWRLGWGWIPFCQLCFQLFFHPLVSSSPCLRTPVVVPLPQLTRGWWGFSHGSDWPGGVLHFLLTGNQFGGVSTFSHFSCGAGGVVDSLRAPDRGCCLHGDLFRWNISKGRWSISRNRGLTSEEPLWQGHTAQDDIIRKQNIPFHHLM